MKSMLKTLVKGQTAVLLVITLVMIITNIFFVYLLLSYRREHGQLIDELNQLQQLAKKYLVLKSSEQAIQKRVYRSDKTPAATIDKLITGTGLNKNVDSLKSLSQRQTGRWRIISLQLTLKDLTIDELYRFLAMLKENREFFIRTMRIKKQFGSEKLLQVVTELFVIRKLQPEQR